MSLPDNSTPCVLPFDIVVIGGGIAGLAFTLRAPEQYRIALVTKSALGESNTRYAQGGLAAAVGPQDNPELHYLDTIASGAGLGDEGAVRTLVEGGPAAVAWLLAQGTAFDRDGETIALGLEAAHSRHRVLHAGGDATGAEIERALVRHIHERGNITVFEHATAIDLLRADADGPIGGVRILLNGESEPTQFKAPLTVLANGGAGQLWAVSSNPAGATGDGIAMALRAGVDVADLEFTQFHPTVFAAPGAAPFLITEAIRGEGGWLRGADGQRFMVDQHPLAELAPRDVVARAVQARMLADERDYVWLDLRHLDAAFVRQRFPTIAAHLREHGLELATDLIPVAPAAHYFIGGIVASPDGTTSVPGVFAIGEVSCTGVHGANRLASNSLLEGLVFGLRAADRIREQGLPVQPSVSNDASPLQAVTDRIGLQRMMSRNVAVVRSADTLREAKAWLRNAPAPPLGALDREGIERANMLTLAGQIVRSAMMREESRGAHYRADFPNAAPALAGRHQIVKMAHGETRRSMAPLDPAHASLNHDATAGLRGS